VSGGPIVLGYDGSESANEALSKTVELARDLGRRVVVVFGYYVSPLGGQGGEDMAEALERVGGHALARARADLEAEGIDVEVRAESGKPADAVLGVAKEVDADLIVLGTVGENAITGAILGSVVLRLLHRSPIPLLIVPTSD
jgi:nucleotide-binding universal stress UspA family protein